MNILAFVVAMVALEIWLVTIICARRDWIENIPSLGSQDVSSEGSQAEHRFGYPHRVSVPSIGSEWSGEEKSHHRYERRFWDIYLLLSFITMVGASVAATAAYLAYGETKRQAIAAEGQLQQAKSQTDAAQRQADVAEKSLILDHRPYLFVNLVDNGAIEKWASGDTNEGDPGWPNNNDVVTISNYGRGPAIIDSAKCQAIVFAGDKTTMIPIFENSAYAPPTEIAPVGAVLGESAKPIEAKCKIDPFLIGFKLPTEEVQGNAPAISDPWDGHFRRAQWLSAGFWLLISVKYKDAFGNSLSTTLCAKYAGQGSDFDYLGGPECNKRT